MTAARNPRRTRPGARAWVARSGPCRSVCRVLLVRGHRGSEVPAAMMPATQDLVPHLGPRVVSRSCVPDHNLLPFTRHDAVDDAGVEVAFAPAPAEHLDLQPRHLVG